MTIAELVHGLRSDGFILLERFLEPALVHDLHAAFTDAFEAKRSRSRIRPVAPRSTDGQRVGLDFRPEGGNHDLNRWNMHLPSCPPFLSPAVLGHPTVVDLVRSLFPDPVLFLLGADIAMPGSGLQSIHQDMDRMGLTIQIPFVDVSEENGPTEIWPRTHLPFPCDGPPSTATHWHTNAQLTEIVKTVKSVRVTMPAGSLFIRDQRMVHRGTVNRSNVPRPLLSAWIKDGPPTRPHAAAVAGATIFAKGLQRVGRRSTWEGLTDLGNSLRLRIDEIAGSDRHQGRSIDRQQWNQMSDGQRYLFRHARVIADTPQTPASLSQDANLARLLVNSIARSIRRSSYRQLE